MGDPEQPRRSPRWRLLAAVLGLVAAGGVFEVWLRPARDLRTSPTGVAEWIWSQAEHGDEREEFYAVRDFRVDRLPPAAALVVAADEEYTLYLNGEVVGVGRWRSRRPLDRYEVDSLLVRGDNRLLAKVGSGRGVGGFILRLSSGDETMAASDSSWRLVRWYREHLKWPATPIEGAEEPRVWGRVPSGRWGRLGAAVDRRLLPAQLAQRQPVWPLRLYRGAWPAGSSARAEGAGWIAGSPELLFDRPLGSWVTLDFGRERSGFLSLLPEARAGLRGYFWTASVAPPAPRSQPPAGRLNLLSGEGAWTDVVARRFRYVTVVATAELRAGNVFLLDPLLADTWLDGGPREPGVLGLELEPPALRPAVEHEFWRQVESLESARRRE